MLFKLCTPDYYKFKDIHKDHFICTRSFTVPGDHRMRARAQPANFCARERSRRKRVGFIAVATKTVHFATETACMMAEGAGGIQHNSDNVFAANSCVQLRIYVRITVLHSLATQNSTWTSWLWTLMNSLRPPMVGITCLSVPCVPQHILHCSQHAISAISFQTILYLFCYSSSW